jgi:hypothetical protein
MNELKTLKDIIYTKGDHMFCEEYGCQELYDRMINSLKQEAIKHIKRIEKSLLIGKMLEEQAGKGVFSDIDREEIAVIDWIKYFFNITGEELK